MITSIEKDFNAEEVVSDILASRNNGVSFQQSNNLADTIKKCVDFYEGRQWGTVGGKTRALPRATFNMTEMIVNNKVAGILATPLKVVYLSSEMPELAKKLTDFHASIEKEIDADDLYEDCVNRAAVEGCAFAHFYWDADAVGQRGEFKGGIRGEMIDALAVTVQNPLEEDIQKQKWVIIESRAEVAAVKEMCEDSAQREHIEPDDNDLLSGTETQEQKGSMLVTVFTRYFRYEGEVYFEKSTKSALIHRARPLNPDINLQKIREYEETEESVKVTETEDGDGETETTVADADTTLQDKTEKERQAEYKATLYPIAVYQYKRRKNSIYGRGEVEPIIPNNRTVNFNAAMMSKSVEDQGFGTIVAKEGALPHGGTLSNDPSKILIDKYKGGGNGFYTLNKTPFNAAAYQLNENIMNTTRTVTGSTEVMTGEVLGKNQSGTSIAYLQQQAQKPIDKLAKRYKKFRERVARIEMQYYVLYYEDKQYETEISVKDLRESAMIAMQNGDETITAESIAQITKPEKIKDVFNGAEFKDIDFDISIEVGAASQYSEIASLQMLENLLASKLIDLRSFLDLYPESLLPNKTDILEKFDEQEQSQINTLTAQVQQYEAELAQAAEVMKRQSEIVNNILGTIQENSRLKAALAQLQAEYTGKINLANQEIIGERQAAQTMADIIHAGTAQKSDTQEQRKNPNLRTATRKNAEGV